MTPLEVILIVASVFFFLTTWSLSVALTQASAELDYTRKLYADAVAQLERVTADRDGWRRLVATVRDGRPKGGF